MPLSEDEQRILQEIEAHLSATDPDLVQQVSETTIYRHGARNIRWSIVGFVAGFALLIFTFASQLWLGFLGFAIMLACALNITANLRKIGRAGLQSLTSSMRFVGVRDALRRPRQRFRRDE